MKKTLVLALLGLFCNRASAQTSAVTINNSSPSTISVVMRGGDNSWTTFSCSDFITNPIVLSPFSSITLTDEYDMQTTIGWAFSIGTYSLGGTHAMRWSRADITVSGSRCTPGGLYLVCPNSNCLWLPVTSQSDGCNKSKWVSGGTGMWGNGDNVTVNVN